MRPLTVLAVAGLAFAAVPAHAQVHLMALNSSSVFPGRRVMLFSHVDGSLINDNFIHESSTGGWGGIVKGIQQVGDDIWISTQAQARLHRYDATGTYLQTIGEGYLANVRGFAHDDGVFYITIGSNVGSIPANSIVKLDLSGNFLGSFVVDASPFDAFVVGPGELLVSHSSGTNDLTRWDFNGNSLGVFHAGPISWAQQIHRRSNGNFLVAGWSGTSGIYEYDPFGNQVNFIDAPGARAAYELETGNIFWTGQGFFVYDVTTGVSTQVAEGTGQYVAPYGSPEPPCYPNCDGSTVAPVLNVEDFTCFISEFAVGLSLPEPQQITHYANCDHSTTPPILNVEDFICFIDAFSQGCP
jgi:hypothetical protein